MSTKITLEKLYELLDYKLWHVRSLITNYQAKTLCYSNVYEYASVLAVCIEREEYLHKLMQRLTEDNVDEIFDELSKNFPPWE